MTRIEEAAARWVQLMEPTILDFDDENSIDEVDAAIMEQVAREFPDVDVRALRAWGEAARQSPQSLITARLFLEHQLWDQESQLAMIEKALLQWPTDANFTEHRNRLRRLVANGRDMLASLQVEYPWTREQ